MKKKKDFFEELRERKAFREEVWKDTDKDYAYANMAKETAREWEIDYLA
ncbi:MAG: hypothetical protein VX370_01290 [Bacteroidota bacterium]|nr:hypothetical protein [Bacteroidota bacterium]